MAGRLLGEYRVTGSREAMYQDGRECLWLERCPPAVSSPKLPGDGLVTKPQTATAPHKLPPHTSSLPPHHATVAYVYLHLDCPLILSNRPIFLLPP
jgi:hypothetical protein